MGGLLVARKEAPVQRWCFSMVRFARRKPLGTLGAVTLILFLLIALSAPLMVTHDPAVQDIPNRLKAPGLNFWFGTDIYGRDVFSRIVFGSRISLYVGVVAVALGAGVGTLLGVISGYFGGWFDLVVQRATDALMGFPPLVLSMAVVVGLGPSLNVVAFAIGLSLIPRVIRVSRASAFSVREEVYVLAARALGCGHRRIIFRHLLPNCLAPVFVLATGYLGTAIVAEASLSFLGLGVPPPEPTWGGMLQFGAKGYLEAAPWLTIFPGLALSLATFGFALFGDALRDVLDPRLRGV